MYNNPIAEYELQKAGIGTRTWKSKDDFVIEAWHKLVQENEKLKEEVRELKEKLSMYEEGDNYGNKKSI